MGAYDMLTATPKVERLRDRHRDYYLELAEQAEPELRGPDQVLWLDLLDSEHDNIRAALEWSLSNGDGEKALRMAVDLQAFWRRHLSEGRGWLERAAAANPAPSALRARALTSIVEIAREDDTPDVRALAEEAVAVAREVGDAVEIARALIQLSYVGFGYGDARAQAEEALRLAREAGDDHLVTRAVARMGHAIFQTEGSFEPARPLLDEALTNARKAGDKRGILWCLYPTLIATPPGPARMALQRESVELCRELRDDVGLIWALDSIGWAALFGEGVQPARAAWDEALEIVRSMPEPQSLDYFLWINGRVAMFAGDVAAARSRFEEVRERATIPLDGALTGLAELALLEGDTDEALSLAEEAVALVRAGGAWSRGSASLMTLGEILLARRNAEGARAVYEEALDVLRPTGDSMMIGFAARTLGALAAHQGETDLARTLIEEAPKDPFRAGASTVCLGDVALLEGELDEATALHRKGLAEWTEHHARHGFPWSFEGLARVAAAQARLDVAARLLGAAEKAREDYGCTRAFSWSRGSHFFAGDDYESSVERLREGLGDDAFTKAWGTGRAMTAAEAVDYALTF